MYADELIRVAKTILAKRLNQKSWNSPKREHWPNTYEKLLDKFGLKANPKGKKKRTKSERQKLRKLQMFMDRTMRKKWKATKKKQVGGKGGGSKFVKRTQRAASVED